MYSAHHQRLADLFPVLAFDTSSSIFFLADQSIGFGFVADPLSGGDEAIADRVNVLLNNDWPRDTLVQFCLISSEDIRAPLEQAKQRRQTTNNPLFTTASDRRRHFLQQGVLAPIDTATQIQVRDFQLVITVKVPLAGLTPSHQEWHQLATLRSAFFQTLKTTGFSAVTLDSQRYLTVFQSLLNRQQDASWRDQPDPIPEPDKPLNQQLFDYDTDLTVEASRLMLGPSHISTLSFKRLPTHVWFGHAMNYIGDRMTGSRGLRGHLMITATLHMPAADVVQQQLDTRRQWAVNQAYGPMLKFVPILAAKKHGFDVIDAALQQGERPVKLALTLTLFSPDEQQAVSDVSNARTYFKELGFEIMADRFFCLPVFLNALPLGADRAAMADLFRYKTLATSQAIPLLPLFADWKGTGTPTLSMISRNGQLMNVSLYDSGSNYNACIAAQSGSGKSFLVNEIIASYLAEGGQCWVIDVGRSYEKLCQLFGGEFLQFDKASHICLNPFDIVENYEEEADVINGIIAAMAAPTQPLTDFQTASLKREVQQLWLECGHALQVDDIAQRLTAHDDQRIRDIGQQLFPFTAQGEYGRFFTGQNNVRFKQSFTVLELEELKGRKHLQQVVLLQLIYQIQQDMYLGQRDRRKIVIIDEAWDLLTHGDVGKFIETGYRRFRKYGGAAVTVTQSVNDLYASATGKAIAENSANMYLLGQKAETINTLKHQERLPLTDTGYELLKTVHTQPGLYSEIFFITERGSGIGRLIVDPFHQQLYSSRAEDVYAIEQLMARGMTLSEAILSVVERHAGD